MRTLAFALTDRAHSLKSACEAFGVEHGKTEASEHGKITAEYIDYNRRDVQATAELAEKLFEEYDLHPIKLQETKAFSPASIGKAYLRAMGVKPILQRHTGFQPYVGYAQTAFFGGRTSAHIRKVAVPVVYTDFLSMYPTVNSLMNLWQFVIARNIKVINHCQEEIIEFLRQITADRLFVPDTWKHLTAFVRLVPNGDILPTRGRYNPDTKDWQVAVNHLYAERQDDALWFSLPDVAASVLLTGNIPKILDAFRLEPSGVLRELTPTKLRSKIDVDPRTQDFFKIVIEERKQLPSRKDLSESESERLDRALKVLANSASYGIYAEMNRQETEQKVLVSCHGIDSTPYPCRVANPEIPGEYCFPPLASLITGAARLMLALLEKSVTSLGGTYAMEDTDSMAIVATENGGLVPCPGGRLRMEDGSEAVQSLSWQQVGEISNRFEALKPYDPAAIKGSILKIEDDNRDPETGKQRQLWCVAISAKRYALFLLNENGVPSLLRNSCKFCGAKNKINNKECKKCHKPVEINNGDDRWSEHGLGHLLNPTDPESDNRDWISQIWLNIVRNTLNLKTKKLDFENIPAIGRVTVSSPRILQALTNLNQKKKYSDQIKPFNFLLTCHVRPFGYRADINPEKFHLIGPYELNPTKWTEMNWVDQYSGETFKISVKYSSRKTVRVKTYADIITEYEFHPEPKCSDLNGSVCNRETVGLLRRRSVRIGGIIPIGKESNSLEEVDAGLIHSSENVYTVYSDLTRDEWERRIRPALKKVALSVLIKETGLSRRMLIKARTGHARPHRQNQQLILSVLRKLGHI